MVILRARLLPEYFLLGDITIPRAHGFPGVKLLEASTFLEAFLPGNLLLLGAYRFLYIHSLEVDPCLEDGNHWK
jgi:hypothetical protein